jgi:hypothetical protein
MNVVTVSTLTKPPSSAPCSPFSTLPDSNETPFSTPLHAPLQEAETVELWDCLVAHPQKALPMQIGRKPWPMLGGTEPLGKISRDP